jgi:hypothetical protein
VPLESKKRPTLWQENIKPEQIALNAKALMQDLEVSPLTPNITSELMVPDSHWLLKPGEMVSIYFDFVGPKIYVDAAWKARPG